MEAAAHTQGGFGGVPQSVGKDFVAADERKPHATAEHMARRKSHGLKTHEIAKEFGVSKATVNRRLKSHNMRQGFNRIGSARD